MAIGAGKKRYNVSLDEAIVREFQSLCKQLGFPSNHTLSTACNEIVGMLNTEWRELLAKRNQGLSFGMGDVFRTMGKQMDLLEADISGMEKAKDAKKPRKTAKANK